MKGATSLFMFVVAATTAQAQPDAPLGSAIAVLNAYRMELAAPRTTLAWPQALTTGSLSDLAASILTLAEHSTIVFGLWCAFWAVVAATFLRPSWTAALRAWRRGLLLALVVVGGLCAFRLVVDTQQPRAVVMTHAQGRLGPGETFLPLALVREPMRIRIIATENGFVLAEKADASRVWLPASAVELVIPRDSTGAE